MTMAIYSTYHHEGSACATDHCRGDQMSVHRPLAVCDCEKDADCIAEYDTQNSDVDLYKYSF